MRSSVTAWFSVLTHWLIRMRDMEWQALAEETTAISIRALEVCANLDTHARDLDDPPRSPGAAQDVHWPEGARGAFRATPERESAIPIMILLA
jgi:hypothetical protein